VLSATTFIDFLELMKKLKKKYQTTKHNYRIHFRVNYLTWPKCLSIGLLSPKDKLEYRELWTTFVENNYIDEEKNDYDCFNAEDFDQIKRLSNYMIDNNPSYEDYDDFRLFIHESDRRRNTSFGKVFPELEYLITPTYYGHHQ
jgi:hypothetical protein